MEVRGGRVVGLDEDVDGLAQLPDRGEAGALENGKLAEAEALGIKRPRASITIVADEEGASGVSTPKAAEANVRGIPTAALAF